MVKSLLFFVEHILQHKVNQIYYFFTETEVFLLEINPCSKTFETLELTKVATEHHSSGERLVLLNSNALD